MSWQSLALLGLNFRFIGPCEDTLLAPDLPNLRDTPVDFTNIEHKHQQKHIPNYNKTGSAPGISYVR
jgi:hypothetical protein